MALLTATSNKRTRVSLLSIDPRGTKGAGKESNLGSGGDTPLIIKIPQATQTVSAFAIKAQPVGAADVDLFDVDQLGHLIQSGVTNVKRCFAQATLLAAAITTLHSVPVTVVAAPGAGITLVPLAVIFQFKYGTVQFSAGGAVSLVYHGATTNLLSGSVAAATINAAANATISAGAPAAAISATANVGLDLLAATQDFASGDSTAIVTVDYLQYTLG